MLPTTGRAGGTSGGGGGGSDQNLGVTRDATSVTVTIDGAGTDAVLPAADTDNAGVMTDAMFDKLAGIASGAQANVPANLSVTRNATSVTVASDTGTDAVLPAADTDNAGVMTDAMFDKLAGIASGAQANVPANLSVTRNATSVTVASDTGTDAVLPAADTDNAGVMTDAQFDKLAGIEAGANNYTHPTGDGNLHVPATSTTNNGKVLTAGATAGSLSWQTPSGGGSDQNLSFSRNATTVTVAIDGTGTDAVLPAADTDNAGVMTDAMFDKLAGIAAGATVNSTDAALLARANHTGTDDPDDIAFAAGDVMLGRLSTAGVGQALTVAQIRSLLKVPYILAQSGTAGSALTGTTTETTLLTISIPGNALGVHGRFRVRVHGTCTSSANNKTIRGRFGGAAGTSVGAPILTTNGTFVFEWEVKNRNSAAAQSTTVIGNRLSDTLQTAFSILTASTIDTTTAQDFVVQGTLANAGESITIMAYIVEMLPWP